MTDRDDYVGSDGRYWQWVPEWDCYRHDTGGETILKEEHPGRCPPMDPQFITLLQRVADGALTVDEAIQIAQNQRGE